MTEPDDWPRFRAYFASAWNERYFRVPVDDAGAAAKVAQLRPGFARMGVTDEDLAIQLFAAGVDQEDAAEKYAAVGATTAADVTHVAIDLGYSSFDVAQLAHIGVTTIAALEACAADGISVEDRYWFAGRDGLTPAEMRAILERGISGGTWSSYRLAGITDIDTVVALSAAGVEASSVGDFVAAGIPQIPLMTLMKDPRRARRVPLPHWREADDLTALRAHLRTTGAEGTLEFAGVEGGLPAFVLNGASARDVAEIAANIGLGVETVDDGFLIGGHWIGEASFAAAPGDAADLPQWWPAVQRTINDHLSGFSFLRYERENDDSSLTFRATFSPHERNEELTILHFVGAFHGAWAMWHEAHPLDGPHCEFSDRVINVEFGMWIDPIGDGHVTAALGEQLDPLFPGTSFAVETIGVQDGRHVMEVTWSGGPTLDEVKAGFHTLTLSQLIEHEGPGGDDCWAMSFADGFARLCRRPSPLAAEAGGPWAEQTLEPPAVAGIPRVGDAIAGWVGYGGAQPGECFAYADGRLSQGPATNAEGFWNAEVLYRPAPGTTPTYTFDQSSFVDNLTLTNAQVHEVLADEHSEPLWRLEVGRALVGMRDWRGSEIAHAAACVLPAIVSILTTTDWARPTAAEVINQTRDLFVATVFHTSVIRGSGGQDSTLTEWNAEAVTLDAIAEAALPAELYDSWTARPAFTH